MSNKKNGVVIDLNGKKLKRPATKTHLATMIRILFFGLIVGLILLLLLAISFSYLS